MSGDEVAALDVLCRAHPGPYRLVLNVSGEPESIFGPDPVKNEIFIEESSSYTWEAPWIQALIDKANAVPDLLAENALLRAAISNADTYIASLSSLDVKERNKAAQEIEQILWRVQTSSWW